MLLNCKYCGGELEITEGAAIITCKYCRTAQTLPKTEDESAHNLFNRANNLRRRCDFDKAEALYEKIIEADETEAEAYWCLVLCKYGIEYVEDPQSGKMIPTCHRASYDSIIADGDYKSAIEYADGERKALYEQQAREIDRIQRDILALAQNEEPYDVFICYKETDENGRRTRDSAIANDIYYQLTQEGFKVFYAAITLEGKLGSSYEPIIFAALNSAKVMLAIGTKPEYFNAVWVKNEWSRFLKIIKKDRKKLLIPCYRDMDAYDIPEEFAHLQAQDMSKIGFINDIVRGIKKVIAKDEPKSTVVKETLVKETVVKEAAVEGGAGLQSLLKRVFIFLEDGDFKSADEYCEKVLDIDPENALGYLGKLMAELKVKKRENLQNCEKPFSGSASYKKILRYADDALKSEIIGYIDYIIIRNKNTEIYNTYSKAVRTMESADTEEKFSKAAELFKSVSDYRDSKELANRCEEKAEEIRLKIAEQNRIRAEETRAEEERKREQERSARERARKKKKLAAITASAVCVVIAFVIVLNSVIIPTVKYNSAIALMNDGKYSDAALIFEEIGEFKDSKTRLEECKVVEAYGREVWDKVKLVNVGDTYVLGACEQDGNTENGNEKIEWQVIAKDGTKALVISKYAIERRRFNLERANVTWESCTLRTWLNGDFLTAAFSDEEIEKISVTKVTADANPSYSTDAGNATEDKVFLLSVSEAKRYLTNSTQRACFPTTRALNDGALVSKWGSCLWWLRTPGSSQECAACIDINGNFNGTVVWDYEIAVRPAMWIDLNK